MYIETYRDEREILTGLNKQATETRREFLHSIAIASQFANNNNNFVILFDILCRMFH